MTLSIIPWLYAWPGPGTPFGILAGEAVSTRAAPFTGFAGVPFGILADRITGVLPEWESPVNYRTRHVPGGDRTITQFTGLGPRTVTYRAFFETRAAFRAMLALRQTTGTLTVVAAGTATDGDYEDIHGLGYLLIAGVTLLDMRAPLLEVDGVVEADCLFQRSAS